MVTAERTSLAGASDAAAPTRGFRPDVEGLRAVAVIAVMAFHAGVPLFSGGYVGVDVFFVLSGFLITGLLVHERTSTGRVTLAGFYARRVRRLLPASALVVVVTLIGSFVVGGPLQLHETADDARWVSAFVANLRFADATTGYFASSRPSPFLHFWSLAVEEQFYVLWPSLLLLVGAGAATAAVVRRRLVTFLGVLVPVSFVWCVLQTRTAPQDAFYLLPARAWELGIGALLAVVPLRAIARRGIAALSLAGIGLIAASIVLLDEATAFPGWVAALPVLGTAMLLLVGASAPAAAAPRALSHPLLQRIGRYSYSLYLWHWVALILAAMAKPRVLDSWPKGALVVAASVPPAIISFHLLEDPVRRSRWLSAVPRRSLALGAGIVLVTLGASAAGVTLPRFDAGRPVALTADPTATDFVPSNLDPDLLHLRSDPGTDVAAACDLDLTTPDDEPCYLGDRSSSTTVALVGDSHAGMWLPAVLAFADAHGWRLEVDVTPGCSALYDDGRSVCDDHRAAVLERLAREKPSVVVLVDYARHSLDRGHTLASWTDGARETMRQLQSSQVLLFAETPRPRGEADSCLAEHVDDVRPCEPDRHDATFREFFDAGRDVADEEGAAFVDLLPLVCEGDRCPVIVGRTPVYYDENHLTSRFVQAVTDDVVAAMDAALAYR